MTLDPAACHAALVARDPRFDGVFFVGVASTGIYCRPTCPARTPRREGCRWFASAAEAESAAFRPCLRCRPELAPGVAPIDDGARVAAAVVQRLEAGVAAEDGGLEAVAAQLELSSRQVRRIVARELGVSPMELVLTRRHLLAKQLLTDTTLPVTDVALASGFGSVRRFNDAFARRYRMPPSRLRRAARTGTADAAMPGTSFRVSLAYRPPFDWAGLLDFLRPRALPGVERIDDATWERAVRVAGRAGWVVVRDRAERRALEVDVALELAPVLPEVLGRLRALFDLAARPDVIADRLRDDARLAPLLVRSPGLRVPGAFDGFELAVRAVLGQQVSVKGASTLAARFADAFGEPVETPRPGLRRLAPTAERVARAGAAEVARIGLPAARAATIIALAREVAAGRLVLEPGAPVDAVRSRLEALPGIGPWTAQYVAMRALGWPDAFPKEDLVLRRALGGVTPSRAEELSQPWRPWRAYATMHLWRSALATDGAAASRARVTSRGRATSRARRPRAPA